MEIMKFKAFAKSSTVLVPVIIIIWLISNLNSNRVTLFDRDLTFMFIIASVTLVGNLFTANKETISQSKTATFLYYFAPFFYLLSITLHLCTVLFFGWRFFGLFIPVSALVNIILLSYLPFIKAPKAYRGLFSNPKIREEEK